MKVLNYFSNKVRIAKAVILTTGICAVTPMISMASSWKDIVTFTSSFDEDGNYSGYVAGESGITYGNYYDDLAFEALEPYGIDVRSTEEKYIVFTNIINQWRHTSMTVDELNARVSSTYAGEADSVIQAIAQAVVVLPKAADAYLTPYNDDGCSYYIDASNLDVFTFGSGYNYGENSNLPDNYELSEEEKRRLKEDFGIDF